MYKDDIGINAGIIWNLLAEKGALTFREIGELTHFRETFIHMATGWLSRENKIRFFDKEGITYIELNQILSEQYY